MKCKKLLPVLLTIYICLILSGCSANSAFTDRESAHINNNPVKSDVYQAVDITYDALVTNYSLPTFSGVPYYEINNNIPFFSEDDITDSVFENYSQLDNLGRCGAAYANICKELMPTEPRGEIWQVKPTGWHTDKYDFVDDEKLYNRCHLIAFQLAGENANEKNLITGTRYMNVVGMLPFENMVADYVKETRNHVLYRVTPVFEGDDLVARGVLMEAESVEDGGSGVLFCVFCYNNQPGITIDYSTGDNWLADNADCAQTGQKQTYILNTGSRKFHLSSCPNVKDISEKNKKIFMSTRDNLIAQGYEPCGGCKP